MGRVTSIVTATGEQTSYTYDTTGEILTATAPDGGVTRYEYDALNRVVSMTDANGATTSYEYDVVGNLVVPAYGPAFEDYIQLAPDEAAEKGEASFYPELETNRFGQKEGIKGGVASPVFLRRDVHVRSAMAIFAKTGEKSKGILAKKGNTAQKNAIQSIKQAAAGAGSKICKGKSKGGNLLNTAAAQNQAAGAQKPSAGLTSPNASHSLSITAPSVKSVTGMPMSCSAQAAVNSAGMSLETWIASMWWLMGADGPAPFGDAIYLGGAAVLGVVSGVVVVIDLIQTSNSVTLEPQEPTIIVDPLPDITPPQIEIIPGLQPEAGSNILPTPSFWKDIDSYITGIPLPEEKGVQIITSNRGELTGKLDGLTVDERNVVNDLLDQGKNVEIIPKTTEHKTSDFYVDGVLTELKTLNGSSLNTAVTRIQDGFAQGAQTVIIDARKPGMTFEQAQTVIDRAIGSFGGNLPGNVEIWTQEGVVIWPE